MHKKLPVIYDGDMGGDDISSIMMLLAHPDRFDLKGITTVFGNVDVEHATQNILSVLSHYNHDYIPVYRGAAGPLQGPSQFGDGAYGDNGIGGVVLNGKDNLTAKDGATEFIIETLMASPEPVIIFGTGPSTNIATALKEQPCIKDKIAAIILMGGGLKPGPAPNVPGRSGNITLHSEFNFFQDPYSANVLFNSGVEIHVMTMDATQHIHLDPAKRERVLAIQEQNVGSVVVQMLAPAEALDRPKFGTDGPFVHDPNVVIYALHPRFYQTSRAVVRVEEHPDESVPMINMRHGKMLADWNKAATVRVVHSMSSPERIFDSMEYALRKFAQGLEPRI